MVRSVRHQIAATVRLCAAVAIAAMLFASRGDGSRTFPPKSFPKEVLSSEIIAVGTVSATEPFEFGRRRVSTLAISEVIYGTVPSARLRVHWLSNHPRSEDGKVRLITGTGVQLDQFTEDRALWLLEEEMGKIRWVKWAPVILDGPSMEIEGLVRELDDLLNDSEAPIELPEARKRVHGTRNFLLSVLSKSRQVSVADSMMQARGRAEPAKVAESVGNTEESATVAPSGQHPRANLPKAPSQQSSPQQKAPSPQALPQAAPLQQSPSQQALPQPAPLQQSPPQQTPQQQTQGAIMSNPQPDGFLAVPPSRKGPGVLVLHAWWGLNDTIKGVCSKLAEAGFIAFAPDLYHGKIADTIPGAEALGQALDGRYLEAIAEIEEATKFLSEVADQADHGVAVVGFSLGAFYALNLAATHPEHIRSVVIFYGSGGVDHSKSEATYLGHFAENDEFEPRSSVDALEAAIKKAGRPVTFHHYPGTGHWFFEPDRTDAFNSEAAALAWERTLAFLQRSSN